MATETTRPAIKWTCSNGNATNGIAGSRVRAWCTNCDTFIGEHLSPTRGPAGYYESKHNGRYRRRLDRLRDLANTHKCP